MCRNETIAAATGMPMSRVTPVHTMVSRVASAHGCAVLNADEAEGQAHLDEASARQFRGSS